MISSFADVAAGGLKSAKEAVLKAEAALSQAKAVVEAGESKMADVTDLLADERQAHSSEITTATSRAKARIGAVIRTWKQSAEKTVADAVSDANAAKEMAADEVTACENAKKAFEGVVKAAKAGGGGPGSDRLSAQAAARRQALGLEQAEADTDEAGDSNAEWSDTPEEAMAVAAAAEDQKEEEEEEEELADPGVVVGPFVEVKVMGVGDALKSLVGETKSADAYKKPEAEAARGKLTVAEAQLSTLETEIEKLEDVAEGDWGPG